MVSMNTDLSARYLYLHLLVFCAHVALSNEETLVGAQFVLFDFRRSILWSCPTICCATTQLICVFLSHSSSLPLNVPLAKYRLAV